VRCEICSGLEHIGIQLDRSRNDAGEDRISVPGLCDVRVIPTNEELMIARQAVALLGSVTGGA
jgi:acetate kinase